MTKRERGDRAGAGDLVSIEPDAAGRVGGGTAGRTVMRTIKERVRDRKWPIIVAAIMLGTGMLFMLFWSPVVHHSNSWVEGADLWGIYRGAHYVGWGFLGGIYTTGNGVVSFPGLEVLLAPLAMLTGKLNLTESYAPFFLARPTAALLLQPVELLLTSVVVFASDALAEQLQVTRRRRIWLCFVVGAIAWPVAAIWGHAEDILAVAFAIYALGAMLKQKWSRVGWLLGFGIVMQPLVALMLPLMLGASPRGQRAWLAVRSALLSVVLVGIAFAGNAAETYTALVKQPTPPSLNHATPWVALAPKIGAQVTRTVHGVSLVPGLGHPAVRNGTARVHSAIEVSGGAGRMIDVLLAVLLGLFVWRRPQSTVKLLWLIAAVLASRCFFEAVMTPYYLAPPLIICLIMAARMEGKRFWPAVILAFEVTVFAYHNLSPWAWWLPNIAGLVGILALSYPVDRNAPSDPPGSSVLAVARLIRDDGDHEVRDDLALPPLPEPALL